MVIDYLKVMYDNIVVSEFTYADGHKDPTTANRTERSNSWFSKLKSSENTNVQNVSSRLVYMLADSFSWCRLHC